nr:hypothetical protein [uncultured Pseudomonas sp.]
MTHQQVQFEKPAQASSRAEVEQQKTVAPTFEDKQREAAFKTVWRDTHRDYRGHLADGSLSLMSWAKFGGRLVTAASITDAELAERLDDAKRRARYTAKPAD